MTLLLAGLDTAKREKGMVLENTCETDVATVAIRRGFAPGVGQGPEEGGWEEEAGAIAILFLFYFFKFNSVFAREHALYYFTHFKVIEIVLWLRIQSKLVNVSCALEKNEYPAVVEWSVLIR